MEAQGEASSNRHAGFVTGMTRSLDPSEFDQKAMELISAGAPRPEMKPVAPPSDAANLIAFLSSDMASQINGAVIPIDNAFSTI
ncbi:hypothetical protein MAP00_003039 [Monascus purpureus]|nr:hypothetical protein MAP00_003039 [Monascus purpureus]